MAKKSAKDFKVTTKYGWVEGYPLNGGFHTGEDRAMPAGTPIIVNKTLLGYSGTTGASTGPHLHVGRFTAKGSRNPKGQGFNLKTRAGRKPTVIDTGYDNRNGHYVRVRNWQGHTFVYLHLESKPVVKAGQIVK